MSQTPVDDIAAEPLVDSALAEAAAVPASSFGPERGDAPFAATTVDDRMAELDSLYASAPAGFTFAVRPPADPSRVSPNVRALPGGDAFAELLVPAGLITFGPWTRAKELYRRVSAFMTRLREGLFGFRLPLAVTGDHQATIAASFDSDVELVVQGPSLNDVVSATIAESLVATRRSLTDALAIFAKVVAIVASVVKAAHNPRSAVRAMWKALTALYDLVVQHLDDQPA